MIIKLAIDRLFRLKTFFLLYFLILFSPTIYGQDLNKVVLSVAKVDITQYELEKNLAIFKTGFIRKNGSNPTSTDVKQWIQSFVDRTYFLADAYQNGFDTLKEVSARVKSMEHLVLTQPGGLLDQYMAREKTTPAEIESTLQTASKKIVVAYLDFKNYTQLVELVGRAELKNQLEFDNAVKKNRNTNLAIYKVDTLRWPFALLGDKVNIANLNLNDVIYPNPTNGHYNIINIKAISVVSKDSISNIKNQVINFLIHKKELNLRAEYEKEIGQKAETKIDESTLSKLAAHLQNYRGLHEFDKKAFKDILQSNIMSYNSNNQIKYISLNHFIEYYNYLPLKRGIETTDDIVNYLRFMVYDDYAYQKAVEHGLPQESKFLMDKDNYKKNIIYNLYENQLKKEINVSETELQTQYNLLKHKFTQATEAETSIYYFNNINSAISATINFSNKHQEVNSLPGLEKLEHKSLNRYSAFFPDSIKNLVLNLKVNEVSRPLFYNGSYIVLVKDAESGERTRSMEEIKDLLIKEVQNEKLANKMEVNLLKLKTLLFLKNKINYEIY